jgi:hypothetical protein
VRAGNTSRFPWLTAKVHAALLQHAARVVPDGEAHAAPVEVTLPSGQVVPIDDPGLLADLASAFDAPLSLLHSGRGLHDAVPLSLITTATLAAIGAPLGLPADARRFRMNLIVEGVTEPFAEDAWVGETLQIGEGDAAPQLRIDRRCERCVMVNLDPATHLRTDAVLRELVSRREACAGLYASVVRPGGLAAGAALYRV